MNRPDSVDSPVPSRTASCWIDHAFRAVLVLLIGLWFLDPPQRIAGEGQTHGALLTAKPSGQP